MKMKTETSAGHLLYHFTQLASYYVATQPISYLAS